MNIKRRDSVVHEVARRIVEGGRRGGSDQMRDVKRHVFFTSPEYSISSKI
jgi:hypothetical protein